MLSGSGRSFVTLALAAAVAAVTGCGTSHNPVAGGGPASFQPFTSSPVPASSPASSLLTAAQAIQLAASRAQHITSFTENLDVETTGTYRTSLSGTIEERSQPAPLIVLNYPLYTLPGEQRVPGGIVEVLTDNAQYLKMIGQSRVPGKPWVKRPVAGIAKSSAGLGFLFQQAQADDPQVQALMLATSTNVRKIGAATIGGVQTTEYTGSFSTRAGLAKLPADLRAEVTTQIQAMGLGTETFELWLDGQQYIRKLITSQQASGDRYLTTMQVTSINQPFSATLPPASQTTAARAGMLSI